MLKKLTDLYNNLTNKEISKIIYIAGVVLDNSKLLELIEQGYPNVYCEHMTIQYGNIFNLPEFLGMEFNFKIDKLFKDKNAIAVTGIPDNQIIQDLMNKNRQHPHITICTAKDIKPVYSNTLINICTADKLIDLNIKMKVEAYCIFKDGSKGWVYSK